MSGGGKELGENKIQRKVDVIRKKEREIAIDRLLAWEKEFSSLQSGR